MASNLEKSCPFPIDASPTRPRKESFDYLCILSRLFPSHGEVRQRVLSFVQVRYELLVLVSQRDFSSQSPCPGVIYQLPLCKNGLLKQHVFAEPSPIYGKGYHWFRQLKRALQGPTVSDEFFCDLSLSPLEPRVVSETNSFSVQSPIEQETRARVQFRFQNTMRSVVIEKGSLFGSPFVSKDRDSLVVQAGSAVISKHAGWVAVLSETWLSGCFVVIADAISSRVLCSHWLSWCAWANAFACKELLLIVGKNAGWCDDGTRVLRVFRPRALRTEKKSPTLEDTELTGAVFNSRSVLQGRFKMATQAEEDMVAILGGTSVQVRQLHQDTGLDPKALYTMNGSFDDVGLSHGFLVTSGKSHRPGSSQGFIEVWSLAEPHQLVYRLDLNENISGIIVRQIGEGPGFQCFQQIFGDEVIQTVDQNEADQEVPTEILPEVAANIAQELWATNAEMHLHMPGFSQEAPAREIDDSDVDRDVVDDEHWASTLQAHNVNDSAEETHTLGSVLDESRLAAPHIGNEVSFHSTMPHGSDSASQATHFSTESAPPAMPSRQCLLTDAKVLSATRDVVDVVNLKSGDCLLAVGIDSNNLQWSQVIVKSVRLLPARERDVTCISFRGQGTPMSVSVTSEHCMLARHKLRSSWEQLQAGSLKDGPYEALVMLGCSHLEDLSIVDAVGRNQIQSSEVLELELECESKTILVGIRHDGNSSENFVAMFGCPPSTQLFCIQSRTFLEVRPANGSDGEILSEPRCSSDPLHDAIRRSPVYSVIRPAHDATCRAFCKYYFKGACKAGLGATTLITMLVACAAHHIAGNVDAGLQI